MDWTYERLISYWDCVSFFTPRKNHDGWKKAYLCLQLKTQKLGQKMIGSRENQGPHELIIQLRNNLYNSEES